MKWVGCLEQSKNREDRFPNRDLSLIHFERAVLEQKEEGYWNRSFNDDIVKSEVG